MADKTDVKKTALVYFGHGLAGYYGLQRIMHGELRDKVNLNLVVVSDKIGNDSAEKAELVRDAAIDYGLEVYSGKLSAAKDKINDNDLGIVMNFDKKIPKRAFDIPIWNVHPSDLPKYRGGAPLEHIIVNGDSLRITVHELTKNYDEGSIIHQSPLFDAWEMDIDELYFFSSRQSAVAMEEALKLFISGDYKPVLQDSSKATYALASGIDGLLRIDWQNDSGEKIYRKVLAGGRNRGAISGIKGSDALFRITEAKFVPDERDNSQLKGQQEYGVAEAAPDGCYAVNVIGGRLYFTPKKSQDNQDIIHTLDRASTGRTVLA